MAKSSRVLKSFPIRLLAVGFGLNWVWEIGQMFAYRMEAGKSVREILFFCTLGAVVDALTISAIHGATKVFLKPHGWKFYLTVALLGAASAVIFEKLAFAFGWWSYNEEMPVVPFVGTGLLPFIQLTLLAPFAIWVAENSRGTSGKNEK